VWAGCTVESQEIAPKRVMWLLDVPARVLFLSCEPLLGPVNLTKINLNWYLKCPESEFGPRIDLDALSGRIIGPMTTVRRINWVIVGGESGHGARFFDLGWARSIVEQCKASGVACFVKQLGSAPMMRRDTLDGRRSGDHPEREWPDGTRFSTMPGHMGTEWQGRWVRLRDSKGGDPAEWPADLRMQEFPQ
jgi:protein gp37